MSIFDLDITGDGQKYILDDMIIMDILGLNNDKSKRDDLSWVDELDELEDMEEDW